MLGSIDADCDFVSSICEYDSVIPIMEKNYLLSIYLKSIPKIDRDIAR